MVWVTCTWPNATLLMQGNYVTVCLSNYYLSLQIHPNANYFIMSDFQTTPQATDSKENKNKTSRTLVTLEDLKKVKLRKVTQVIEKDKENTAPESETTRFKLQPRKPLLNKLNQRDDVQCVVSLREIKNVTLKRTKTETEMEKINLR